MIRGSHGLPVPAGHFAPKSGSKELAVLRTTPILGSISGVALVGKFRSRIRILQFSTRKITPHGNVHISSARRPIVFFCFFWLLYYAEPIWASHLVRTSPAQPTVQRVPRPLCRTGLLFPLPRRILALRGPNPQAGLGDPRSKFACWAWEPWLGSM